MTLSNLISKYKFHRPERGIGIRTSQSFENDICGLPLLCSCDRDEKRKCKEEREIQIFLKKQWSTN